MPTDLKRTPTAWKQIIILCQKRRRDRSNRIISNANQWSEHDWNPGSPHSTYNTQVATADVPPAHFKEIVVSISFTLFAFNYSYIQVNIGPQGVHVVTAVHQIGLLASANYKTCSVYQHLGLGLLYYS